MSTCLNLAAAAVCAVALAAQTTPPPKPAEQPSAAPAREPGLYATMTTSMGPIVLKLHDKEAPVTVKNFIDLALGRKSWPDPRTGQPVKKPLYNGTIFHRVIPGFMIQGGDPLGTGRGNTTRIKDEFVPTLKFDKPGILAMANIGEPNTGSCQFFITDGPAAHLNGQHTIFGQVVEGQDVVAKIARVPVSPRDPEHSRPATPPKIVSITFKREGAAPANDPLGPPARRTPAGTQKAAPAKKAPAAKKQ